MEKIILVDSCCSLPKEFFEQRNYIKMIGMPIKFEDDEFIDIYDNNFDLVKFYNMLNNGKNAVTSQIVPQRFIDFFNEHLDKEVYYISFSSGMSGTFESAVIASREFDNVTVIDSLSASVGYGALIYSLALKIDNKECFDIEEYIKSTRLYVNHIFTVDDLMYLSRGGRLSGVSAVIGSAINMKPILRIDEEGRLVRYKKVRGRKKALLSLVDEYIEKQGGNTKDLFVSHANALDDAVEIKEKIKKKYNDLNIFIIEQSPTIGAHVGPGLIVIGFIGDKR